MSAALSADTRRRAGLSLEPGEIHTVAASAPLTPASREDLRPEEEALSLPSPAPLPGPIAPLTRLLGPLLTVASPAWSGDPVPGMRALQRKLVEHSLSLPEGERGECLAAISVVEDAVRLRLRLQQMRMTEAEREIKTDQAQP